MSQRHAIDSIAVNEGVIFGWGWFLDEKVPARRCVLEVTLRGGGTQSLPCVPGGMRNDLKSAFPHVGHAAAAGFMIRGRLKGQLDESVPARLVCTMVNGQEHVSEVWGFPSQFMAGYRPSGRERWKAFRGSLSNTGLTTAVRAEWDCVRDAVGRWWARRRIDWALLSSRDVAVVFDHAMGGGANHYRKGLVESMSVTSQLIMTVTFRVSSLDYHLVASRKGRKQEVVHDSLQGVLSQLNRGAVAEIHVNNLVSYVDPLGIVRWVREQAHRRGAGVHLHLHDFYAACPSWTLIDAWDKFCGVPDLDVCRKCLPVNKAHTLSLAPDMEVSEWRAAWQGLLESARTIVAFSQASVDILRRAYPGMDPSHIVVQPHYVDAADLRPVQPTFGEVLVIGVIGHISAAKGALMLQAMALHIRLETRPIRIVVLGTMEHHHAEDGIHVTGEYDKKELPDLLEQHQVGVCMLPSVCAETFSYVTAEIMAMRMPLAVFALGAPAERTARYDRGLVISRMDAPTALDEIQAFADALRNQ
jgi:hypothetical protein